MAATSVQTYDTNDLSLATTDPVVTQLNLSVSSSLMTNYQPARAVDSQQSVEVAEDINGNPMVFSIGTTKELYVIASTADPSAPWSQTNLTAGLGTGWEVETFALLQAPNQALYLAVAITDTSGVPHLYLTGALANDPTAVPWTTDFTPVWVERAFSEGFTSVGEILMAAGAGAGSPPVVVATATLPSGEAQRYYVNGDVTSQVNLWQPWPVPQNASSILDVAPGSMPILGAGSFVLYKVGAVTQLDFTKAELMNGQYISRSFVAPPGATALGALANPDGTLDLYVAGDGIYVFTAANMTPGASAQLIGPTAPAGADTEMTVRQDSGSIAVWVLDGGVLSYLHGTKGPTVQWTPPLPVQSDVGQIAALRNTVRDTNELFVVTADNQLGYLYQDPTSTMWRETLIPLTDVGSALPFSCYTTQITLTDQDGNPVTSGFTLAATEWTYLTVNGQAHIVDPHTAASVTPDPTGALTVITKVSTLSAPTLNLGAEFLSVTVDITPQALLNNNLKLFTSESALAAATTQTGQPVISGPTQIPLDKAAGALSQLTTLHDAAIGTTPTSPSASVRARAASEVASNRIDATLLPADFGFGIAGTGTASRFYDKAGAERRLPALAAHAVKASTALGPHQALVSVASPGLAGPAALASPVSDTLAFFGDVMETIENGLEAVGAFLVQVANDVATFTIQLADKTMSFLLDSVEKVMRVIGWVLEQIEIGLEKALEWLGFLFDWDDILAAHRIMVNVANKGFEYVESKLADAETTVHNFFEELKAQFNQLPAALPGAQAGSTVLSQSKDPGAGLPGNDPQSGYLKSPGGNFANYHLQHSGVLAATPPKPAPSPTGNPIVDMFTQVIEPLGDDIGTTVENLAIDLRDGFVDGTLTPDAALTKLKTDAILGVINSAEDASEGALTVATDLVSSIQDLVEDDWNIPFLTPLYELVTGGSPLNLLDAVALLLAIPAVPLYKLASGQSPFADGTHGLDDASVPAQQFFANLAAAPSFRAVPTARAAAAAPAAAERAETPPAAILYSQIGGGIYLLAEVAGLTIDGIEAEAAEETPQAVFYIHLAVEAIMQAGSFPVGDGSAVTLLRILWGFYWVALLRHVALILSRGALSKPVGVMEIFLAVVKALMFLGAIVYQATNDSGTELALEWETFFGNLLDATSRGIGGAAKLDPDKELTGLALDAISVGVGWVAALFDAIRYAIILTDDEYNEFHAF